VNRRRFLQLAVGAAAVVGLRPLARWGDESEDFDDFVAVPTDGAWRGDEVAIDHLEVQIKDGPLLTFSAATPYGEFALNDVVTRRADASLTYNRPQRQYGVAGLS
jgi:hypothetical protein